MNQRQVLKCTLNSFVGLLFCLPFMTCFTSSKNRLSKLFYIFFSLGSVGLVTACASVDVCVCVRLCESTLICSDC